MDLRPFVYILILAGAIWFTVAREKKQLGKRLGAKPAAPNPAAQTEEPIQRKPGDMALKVTGEGEKISCGTRSAGTTRLMWVSRETAEDGNPLRIRIPRSTAKTVRQPLPFTAADKVYISTGQLTHRKAVDGTFRDCHGRVVLNVTERFPCFDSSDLLNEDRCYRWWIIIEDGFVSVVHSQDGSKEIWVTDDAQDMEPICLEALEEYGYIVAE